MRPLVLPAAGLLALFGLAHPISLQAQVAGAPFPNWHHELMPAGGSASRSGGQYRVSDGVLIPGSAARSHAGTGLLIGGIVGAVATTVFLVGFCGDPDTACGADEVGRAVVLIAVPCAAVGTFIGWLVRTEGEP
jgi:hypothetical protein